MNKCFITKLNAVVEGVYPPRDGFQQIELYINTPKDYKDLLAIHYTYGEKSIKLLGNGYLIATDGSNLGKEVTEESGKSIGGIHVDSPNTRVIIEVPNNFLDGMTANSIKIAEPAYYHNIYIPLLNLSSFMRIVGDSAVNEVNLGAEYIEGNIENVLNLWGRSNILVQSLKNSTEVYGSLDNVVLLGDKSKKVWPYNCILSNMPNITGNIESILNQCAERADYGVPASSHNVTFNIRNCPLIRYNGEQIGESFIKSFKITEHNTWEAV